MDRWTISPKIWHECVYCPKFDACDEIAVFMNLAEPEKAPQQLPPEVSMEMWQGVKLGRLRLLRFHAKSPAVILRLLVSHRTKRVTSNE